VARADGVLLPDAPSCARTVSSPPPAFLTISRPRSIAAAWVSNLALTRSRSSFATAQPPSCGMTHLSFQFAMIGSSSAGWRRHC
jgi:hypothetical protein